jgi:hypothetical protein
MPVLLPSDSVTPLFARATQYSAIVKIPSDGSGVSTTAYGNFLKYRNNNPYGYTVSTLSNTWTSLTTVSTIPYTYSGLLITDVTTFNATTVTSVSAFSAVQANKTGLTTLSTWQGTVFYAYNGTTTVRSVDSGNTWSNYGTGLANYKTGWSSFNEGWYMMVADNSNNIHWTTSTNTRTGLSWFTATITSPVAGSITKLHGSTYGGLGVALVPSSSTVYISTTNPPTTWSKLSGYCPDAVCSSSFYMVGVSNTGTTGAYLDEFSPTAWTPITQIYASKLISQNSAYWVSVSDTGYGQSIPLGTPSDWTDLGRITSDGVTFVGLQAGYYTPLLLVGYSGYTTNVYMIGFDISSITLTGINGKISTIANFQVQHFTQNSAIFLMSGVNSSSVSQIYVSYDFGYNWTLQTNTNGPTGTNVTSIIGKNNWFQY